MREREIARERERERKIERSIPNKMFERTKKFRYGMPKEILSKGKTPRQGEGGVRRPPPLPSASLVNVFSWFLNKMVSRVVRM